MEKINLGYSTILKNLGWPFQDAQAMRFCMKWVSEVDLDKSLKKTSDVWTYEACTTG